MAEPGQAAVPVEALKALALVWREKADESDRDRASIVAYSIAARDVDDTIAHHGAPAPDRQLADYAARLRGQLEAVRMIAESVTEGSAGRLPDTPRVMLARAILDQLDSGHRPGNAKQ